MAELTLFENIFSGAIPSHMVARGENWYAFLDIQPRRAGHTLVIPKAGVQYYRDLSDDDRAGLNQGIVEVQNILSKHFETNDFSVVLHDGANAGQEIPHVHFHVIPRTQGDGGKSLLAMWPQAPAMGGEIDHESLAQLSVQLRENGD